MSQTADVTPGKLPRQTVENPDGTTTELTYLEPTEETLRVLVDLLFKERWAGITVGPCIEGVVFEDRFKEPPKVSLLDGCV